MGSKKEKRTLSNVVYIMVEFEPKKLLIYSDEIDRIKELREALKKLPFKKHESGVIYKTLHGIAVAMINREKVDLGYFGWEGWDSCIDHREDLLSLPPVFFSAEFLMSLGPHSSYDDNGKAKVISLVRKKDRELLVWKKIEGEQ